jgi:hypothetical protein
MEDNVCVESESMEDNGMPVESVLAPRGDNAGIESANTSTRLQSDRDNVCIESTGTSTGLQSGGGSVCIESENMEDKTLVRGAGSTAGGPKERKEKVAVTEEEMTKLRELLWPKEEDIEIFKGVSEGAAPDERMILRSRTFFNALKNYYKSGKSILDKKRLFAVALEAQSRFSVRVTVEEREVEVQESEGEALVTADPSSRKRKRQSQKQYVFVKELAQNKERESTKESYASKAKLRKGEKRFSNFLLHIYGGTEHRVKISEELYQKVWAEFQLLCLERLNGVQCIPAVEWNGFADQDCGSGAGLIAAVNEDGVELIKSMIRSITVEGQTFRAWDKHESRWTSLTLLLHKSLNNSSTFTDDILKKALQHQNGGLLPNNEEKVRSCGSKVRDGNRIFRLLVDDETLLGLEASDGKVQILGTQSELFRGNHPLIKNYHG